MHEPSRTVDNILYVADSYKISHYLQYPPGTTEVYSYFESRGGEFDRVCFFGLQYLLKKWMTGKVVTEAMLEDAKEFYKDHFNGLDMFNEEGWRHIIKAHGGKLPLRVKAVPEGSVIPVKNVLFTIENTDPAVPWLTNWFETLLLQVWYPMTVCTISRMQKLIISKFLKETTGTIDKKSLAVKLHDFGYRGASSVETAAIGDAAHLVNFVGTDTIAGITLARKYYGCHMAGFSIPASEHSTMTIWGENNEASAFRNMLTQFEGKLVACVCDSYDLFNVVSNVLGKELRADVIKHGNKGGILVIRPDSGDPSEMVVEVLRRLEEHFECSTNEAGFKMLPNYLRVIQGDGISYQTIGKILDNVKKAGWSAENVSFGTGGALLQKLHRDTFKCAFKACYAVTNGEGRAIFKDPAQDHAKRSKKGKLTLERTPDGGYATKEEGTGDPSKDLLELVFENGELVKEYTFDDIRARADITEDEVDAIDLSIHSGPLGLSPFPVPTPNGIVQGVLSKCGVA